MVTPAGFLEAVSAGPEAYGMAPIEGLVGFGASLEDLEGVVDLAGFGAGLGVSDMVLEAD